MRNPEFKLMGAVCKRNASLFYKNYWTLEMALPLGEARESDDKQDSNKDNKNDSEDKTSKSSQVSTNE